MLLASLALTLAAAPDVVPVQAPLVAGADQSPAELLHVARGDAGGRLAIDCHARFMVARDDDGRALNWNDCGVLKWSFGQWGFDAPRAAYPTFRDELDGTPAVVFGPRERLRYRMGHGETWPDGLRDADLTLELWVRVDGRSRGGALLTFGDTVVGVEDFALEPSDAWRHLAATSDGRRTRLWVDSEPLDRTLAPLTLSEDGPFELGGGFRGAIAAVRVHDAAAEREDLRHNQRGGPLLGTALFDAVRADRLDDLHVGDPDRFPPRVRVRTSEHFRSAWDPTENPDPDDDVAARVESEQLPGGERAYDWMAHRLGLHMPIVSLHPELRGDGRKYRLRHGNKWTGGDVMGFDGATGFGWGFTYAGYFNPHELVHGAQAHQQGSLLGHWHETHANYACSAGGEPRVVPSQVTPKFAHVHPASGNDYYHAYLIWEHLARVPEYGPLYSTYLWNHRRARDLFPPDAMRAIDPDPSTSFDDEWVHMAARNVTWDYPGRPDYAERAAEERYPDRRVWTRLEPIAHLPGGWYRPPAYRAPQSFGHNLCPLEIVGEEVLVELAGPVDPRLGSSWRMLLVAVDGEGRPRYGEVGSEERPVVLRTRPEDELYLVVAATPVEALAVEIFESGGPTTDYRHPAQSTHPYRVRLRGARPRGPQDERSSSYAFHPNGGGRVARTARVHPTAWIGPEARVDGRARVDERARVEGRARVTGDAVLEAEARVAGDALVADFAVVGARSVVDGASRLLEHAGVAKKGHLTDGAIAKGHAQVRGRVGGSARVDGNYNKANALDDGWWFTWSWGSGQNRGEGGATDGVFVRYDFETDHPYRVPDAGGVTWGEKVGSARVEDGSLVLDGDGFVDLPPSVARQSDLTLELEITLAGAKGGPVLVAFDDSDGQLLELSIGPDLRPTFEIQLRGSGRRFVGSEPLVPGRAHRLRLQQSGDQVELRLDGRVVGAVDGSAQRWRDVDATTCWLGRGVDGSTIDARIDDLTLWSRALDETRPPDPDPAAFLVEPEALSATSVLMQAVAARDSSGPVEYRFLEHSGLPGATPTDWTLTPAHVDRGLVAGATYVYSVEVRDARGNVTAPSERVSVTLPRRHPRLFVHGGDPLAIEAEDALRRTPGALHGEQWVDESNPEASRGVVVHAVGTGVQVDRDFAPDGSARLDYPVHFERPGRYRLWLRGLGPRGTDNSVHAGIDRRPFSVVDAFASFDPVRQLVWKGGLAFEVQIAGVHEINVWVREDGTRLDKLWIGANGRPSGEGPLAVDAARGLEVQPPSAPPDMARLRATAGAGAVALDWEAMAWGATRPFEIGLSAVVIERSVDGGAFVELTRVPAESSAWIDRDCPPGRSVVHRASVVGPDDNRGAPATSDELVALAADGEPVEIAFFESLQRAFEPGDPERARASWTVEVPVGDGRLRCTVRAEQAGRPARFQAIGRGVMPFVGPFDQGPDRASFGIDEELLFTLELVDGSGAALPGARFWLDSVDARWTDVDRRSFELRVSSADRTRPLLFQRPRPIGNASSPGYAGLEPFPLSEDGLRIGTDVDLRGQLGLRALRVRVAVDPRRSR